MLMSTEMEYLVIGQTTYFFQMYFYDVSENV